MSYYVTDDFYQLLSLLIASGLNNDAMGSRDERIYRYCCWLHNNYEPKIIPISQSGFSSYL
jgi:hypothetical protein